MVAGGSWNRKEVDNMPGNVKSRTLMCKIRMRQKGGNQNTITQDAVYHLRMCLSTEVSYG